MRSWLANGVCQIRESLIVVAGLSECDSQFVTAVLIVRTQFASFFERGKRIVPLFLLGIHTAKSESYFDVGRIILHEFREDLMGLLSSAGRKFNASHSQPCLFALRIGNLKLAVHLSSFSKLADIFLVASPRKQRFLRVFFQSLLSGLKLWAQFLFITTAEFTFQRRQRRWRWLLLVIKNWRLRPGKRIGPEGRLFE